VQQRLPSLRDHPIGFAHRGARAHAPENTLEAFALALKLGATGLESDVWLSADGIPVLDHDGVVRVRHRPRPIEAVRRAQLPKHIPELAELVEHCGTNYHLSLDLCGKDPAGAVIAVVREAAPDLVPRLWLCHPRLELLSDLRRRDADVKLVDSTRLERIKEGPERRAATLAERGIDALNMYQSDWTGGLTTLLHRFERAAFGWGFEYERQLQAGYRMGLDAVYCDWVDRMMETYREELGKPEL
jgi:glycerophosphoryl diester phosphodiesterase